MIISVLLFVWYVWLDSIDKFLKFVTFFIHRGIALIIILMIIYHSTKREFLTDVFNGTIADDIDQAFVAHLGRHTSPNEVLSWKNSMMHMYKVMDTPEIPDNSIVAIEYQIPLTSKRIDFIISGEDADRNANVVIIELKQWEKAQLSYKSGIIQTRFYNGEKEVAHPSYQAWSYAYMLENYNEYIQQHSVEISPCAYLHNYTYDDIITADCYKEYIDRAPLFLKTDSAKLQDFIKKHIKYGGKDDIVWLIENGKLRPSKQLADSLSSMLKNNREFVLLDEQLVVYETALAMARKAQGGQKQVLVVEGGPGTGKSVVAVNLLVNLNAEGLSAIYVTKNAAPRDVYSVKLSNEYKKTYINNLFVGSGSFIDTPEDSIPALVVDEAHRLNEKSGLFNNLGENQIKEIIRAANFSVFFVDDRQRIHIKDIGNKRSIVQIATECGAEVYVEQLSSQFRCNGSDGYLSWLDNTLQITETANIKLSSEDYEFIIFDNPQKLFDAIAAKNMLNNKSRVVAGYCWDWDSKTNPSTDDIIFPEFNFRKRWNLKNQNLPWILGEDSVNEIGCIHTCQGLELDYVGVIVGRDLQYVNGKVVTDVTKRSVNDQSVKGFKSYLKRDPEKAKQDFDEIIKNTYRTLMTRGMKGCYVYFCDKELANHFANQMNCVSQVIDCGYRLEPVVGEEVKYVDFLPFFSIKAACGYFGDGEAVENLGWVKVDNLGKLNRNMFVVQAVGHSMEPLISDGDYCVFRANPAGSRQGKIVLIQHYDFYDADYSGSYSIKKYTSSKRYNEDGTWMHEEIVLCPLNTDFAPIVLREDDAYEFRVIGEFIGVVKNS